VRHPASAAQVATLPVPAAPGAGGTHQPRPTRISHRMKKPAQSPNEDDLQNSAPGGAGGAMPGKARTRPPAGPHGPRMARAWPAHGPRGAGRKPRGGRPARTRPMIRASQRGWQASANAAGRPKDPCAALPESRGAKQTAKRSHVPATTVGRSTAGLSNQCYL